MKKTALVLLSVAVMLLAGCKKEKQPTGSDKYPNTEVNLGLSVNWARCNLGATTPSDYGDYYAWGMTELCNEYNWKSYKYCDKSYNTLKKYCLEAIYGYKGYTDTNVTLLPEDDAATLTCGNSWRIPTVAEWQELVDKCKWEYMTAIHAFGDNSLGEVYGWKISGAEGYEDNFIFIPLAGMFTEQHSAPVNTNTLGSYWTSEIVSAYSPDARYMRIDSAKPKTTARIEEESAANDGKPKGSNLMGIERFRGLTIRAVK